MTFPRLSRLALGLVLIPSVILPFGVPVPTPRTTRSTWCPPPAMRAAPVETAALDDLTLTLSPEEAATMPKAIENELVYRFSSGPMTVTCIAAKCHFCKRQMLVDVFLPDRRFTPSASAVCVWCLAAEGVSPEFREGQPDASGNLDAWLARHADEASSVAPAADPLEFARLVRDWRALHREYHREAIRIMWRAGEPDYRDRLREATAVGDRAAAMAAEVDRRLALMFPESKEDR